MDRRQTDDGQVTDGQTGGRHKVSSPKVYSTRANYKEKGGLTCHFLYFNFRNNSNCYRIFHTGKLWDMFNEVFHEHQKTSHHCQGRLNFDYSTEEQRMFCWRERVICDRCSYTSKKYNLYDEIETGKVGRKTATANVGLNIALSQTPIGPSSIRKLCLSTSIPAPSRRGLQKTANKVSKVIEEVNKRDMKARRQGLKTINLLRGQPAGEISVQSDGVFNNALYSGIGRTPFQPATQCCYTMVENITPKKQVIAIENINKLCSKHGFHSVEDENGCDIMSEKCSSQIPMEQSIGDEKEWAKACLLDLKEDNLEVKNIITDPDTSAYKAAEELNMAKITKLTPEHQIDTRHLAENHRKFIKNKCAVLNMMPGLTKSFKQKMQNRFSTDLSLRCQAEFENCHQRARGDLENLKISITESTEAILRCYAGDHKLCRAHSSVCAGENDNNWILKNEFLPNSFKISLNTETEKILRECINFRLGPTMLEKTKFNSNTQKVESVNNVIRRSLPKNVTYPRNFSGRAHSAIFSSNNGPGESIARLCNATGCSVPPNSRVSAALLNEQRISEKEKERKGSSRRKLKRKMRRIRLFKLYEKHQEEIAYRKAQLLERSSHTRQLNARIKKDHSYIINQIKMKNLLKKSVSKDHTYIKQAIKKPYQKMQAGECSKEQQQ